MGQQCAVNSLWAFWGGGLPVGRGSESRILIPAPRTSSLGNTIWYCHTDACKPVDWSLQLGAHFVNFGTILVRFLHKWGSVFFFLKKFWLFCFAGQFNHRWLAGERSLSGDQLCHQDVRNPRSGPCLVFLDCWVFRYIYHGPRVLGRSNQDSHSHLGSLHNSGFSFYIPFIQLFGVRALSLISELNHVIRSWIYTILDLIRQPDGRLTTVYCSCNISSW